MLGHNSDEGILFTPPQAQSASSFAPLVAQILPSAAPSTLSLLATSLYPAASYASPLRRYATAYADAAVTCTTRRLSRGQHAYVWSVPPGWHALDQEYTFYDGPAHGNPLAAHMQRYFVNFVAAGDPAARGPLPVPAPFPVYGDGAAKMLLNFSTAGVGVVQDDADAAERCQRWINLDAELWR